MEILYLIAGLISGALAAFFYAKMKFSSTSVISDEEAQALKQQVTNLMLDKTRLETSIKYQIENADLLNTQLQEQNRKTLELTSVKASLEADYENLRVRLAEQKSEIEELQKKFTAEFKNIANEILEDKSKKFTEQNQTNIDAILKPLNEKIQNFEKKVNDVYVNESKDRAGLLQQILNLQELNNKISNEANNLTKALKGDVKVQGNWGEMILETILEKSGLSKDREYKKQILANDEEGRKFADFIVYLPENRHIVIDSKVSLVAYDNFCSAESEELKTKFAKDHVASIRNHLKILTSKNYQNLYGLNSLDFVLLFMPIESALGVAIQNDMSVFNEAFEKNIIIVTPSTLLATLRTIANIWRQEKQNKNAQEIAKQSGALYDKFVGVLNAITDMGKKLDSAKNVYDDVVKKLSSGNGNILISIEKIKKLGAKTSKQLPDTFSDKIENFENSELLEEENQDV